MCIRDRKQVETIYSSITETLRDDVAAQVIEELLTLANDGEQLSALKLGQTYMKLLVAPDYKSAYIWLSIAQAYGLEGVTDLLEDATKQLTLEEVLEQQDQASETFEIIPCISAISSDKEMIETVGNLFINSEEKVFLSWETKKEVM